MLRADKGNATVIQDRVEYDRKMLEHLSASGSYRRLDKDPTKKIVNEVTKAIKNSALDENTKKKLIPKDTTIPRIYGLPKIHKEGAPIRPIVNTIGSPTYLLAKFLARILKGFVGKTPSFIKDSTHLVSEMEDFKVEEGDILASFDVVSLFTKIPVDEALRIVREVTDEETEKLVRICLKSTFFTFKGVVYEQVEGVAMGSPLSPIVANLYMEAFEKSAIDAFPLKPKWWKRFVDDTNINWPHGRESLIEFLGHLNSRSDHIKFTMEVEEDNHIPFLDVLITKRNDGTLGHQVYRKKTHTDRYLHVDSHHLPSQKIGVINTLVTRAIRISDEDHLEQELDHLSNVFQMNGYNKNQITKVIHKARKKSRKQNKNIDGTKIVLPYIKGTTDVIAKILRRKDMRVTFSPPKSVGRMLDSSKDQ